MSCKNQLGKMFEVSWHHLLLSLLVRLTMNRRGSVADKNGRFDCVYLLMIDVLVGAGGRIL